MKTISIFILLIYWSFIIFAPVMAKELQINSLKGSSSKIIDQKQQN